MLQPGRKYFATDGYRYGFNGKENDNDVKGVEGSQQDYGMRIYDPRLGKFLSVDPLQAKYPGITSYCFVNSSPIRAVDPDGRDIYILFYTKGNDRGDEMFQASALTRKHDIEKSKNFDPAKDKVVLVEVQDMASIKDKVKETVDTHSPKYGKTKEFSIWSHAGLDGPIGTAPTSDYPVDGEQMAITGWGEINFNWKDEGEGTLANFFGCQTGVKYTRKEIVDYYEDDGKQKPIYTIENTSFAKEVSELKNFKNVTVTGQSSYSYPSKYTDYRLNSENGPDNFINSEDNGVINFQLTYLIGGKRRGADWNNNEQNVAYPMQINKNGTTTGSAYQSGTKKPLKKG